MPDGYQSSPLFGIPQRLPPANVDAECAFLGALLYNNKALDRAPNLEPDHFAHPANARIFAEARRLIGAGHIADPITLKTAFEHTGILDEVGGTAYLMSLVSAMIGVISIGDYAKLIRDCWMRREMIEAGERLVNAAFGEVPDADSATIAAEAIARIDGAVVGSGVLNSSMTTLDGAMDAAIAAMEAAQDRKGPAGISTGFQCIDDRLGGLEPGHVYVLAGRPGMGKSALGHGIAINAARSGVGVLELSLEMSAVQLGRRALSAASGVAQIGLKTGHINNEHAERLVRARRELAGLPLTIDDAGGQTPAMIAAKARAAKRKHGLGLLMVDHLNLMRAEDADARHGDTSATGKASNMMLQVAKDCGCPVLLLAQLNRGPENREDKRPTLSDLRQSGNIEQDAYAVGFVYRPEYYLGGEPEKKDGETAGKHHDRISEWEERKRHVAGRAELIWAKVRDGEPGTDHLTFDGPTTSFGEPA